MIPNRLSILSKELWLPPEGFILRLLVGGVAEVRRVGGVGVGRLLVVFAGDGRLLFVRLLFDLGFVGGFLVGAPPFELRKRASISGGRPPGAAESDGKFMLLGFDPDVLSKILCIASFALAGDFFGLIGLIGSGRGLGLCGALLGFVDC